MLKLVLFFYGCFLLSCNNSNVKPGVADSNEKVILSKDSVSYELFPAGKGYGFNILKAGKIYIHQPVIPCWQGVQYFTSEQDALSVAKFIVAKLRSKNFKFLLQKFEIDSLIGREKSTTDPADSFFYFNQEAGIQPSINFEDSGRFIPTGIPSLPDAPYKKKWTVKENIPFGNRGGGFSFAIGKFVYIGSGENKDEIIKDFWCYNTDEETWTCLAEIPEGCFSGIAFSIFNKGYAGMGTEIGTSSGKFKNHMFKYDPEINSWKRINDFPGTGRIDPIGFIIDNKAYVGTGYDGSNTRDFYEFDSGKDSWKRIADFAGGDLHASIGIGTGKRGFVVAGSRAPNDFKFVYEYIPSINKWEQRQDLPGYSRQFLCGNFIDSNYIIAGCGGSYEAGIRLRDFYIYNITANTWSRTADYPVESNVGNSRPCGANVDGKVYMGTGYNVDYLHDWNVFEYYFSVRKDTGNYNENTCYPLQYNGKWELYQECNNDDCFAGFELKSNQPLGNLCYSSRFTDQLRNITLNSNQKNKFFLLPRNFVITTSRQPQQPVSLRLFFTKAEIENAIAACNEKDGVVHTLNDIQLLQTGESHPGMEPSNNNFRENSYQFIKPQWFSYGFNGETLVAEFPVTSLHSEFYLTVPAK